MAGLLRSAPNGYNTHMDLMRPARAFNRFQQRHDALGLPLAVLKKFGNDQGGNLAALVAYYAFFSIFPLLLVFVTILGFVLNGDASAESAVKQSIVGELPIIGKQIQLHALSGSVLALVVGIAGALWGGLGVTSAAQNALDQVCAVPFKDRPSFLTSRLRGIGLLVVLGVLFVISAGASGIVSGGFGGVRSIVAGYIVSLLVNVVLFIVAFRLMTARTIPTRNLRTGAIVAAVVWTILQAVGGYYIGHVLKSDSNTYGTFAFVIALLVWLHLGAQLTLYAAEINVVVHRRLWPRSLFGPPQEPADQKTYEALAKVEERHDAEHVDVEFRT